jgi:4-amino-4-deoxy-L-arabinose transferase-like glycosyltransferase
MRKAAIFRYNSFVTPNIKEQVDSGETVSLTCVRGFSSCVAMVLVALALRLLVMGFLYRERLNVARDHYEFAYENGRVARAIASGKGISNPLFDDTGPTAMLSPVYPYILAGIFKLLGVYTRASAIAALSLNCILSALTCVPVFFIARKCFGKRVARWSGWAWVFSPYGIYFAADWIWPTCLTTLLLSIVFLLALRLENSTSWRAWTGFGVFAAVAALNDPVVLSVVPLLALWSCYRLDRGGGRWLPPAVVASLVFVALVSPWFLRNYNTFHRFIPFRSGLGLELYVGNNGYTTHWANTTVRLANNATEYGEYKQLGELAYMAKKRQQALEFMSEHPGLTALLIVRRMVYLWTGFWSLDRQYLKGEPLDPPNIFLATTLTVLALAGLRYAFKESSPFAIPFMTVLVFFPAVYYVTHPEVYYLRPIDPLITVLAAYAVCSTFEHRRSLNRVSGRVYA